MTGIRYFLDILPLRDYSWTGIPTVTANLARYLLDTCPEASVFYYGTDVVLPQFVRTAIDEAPGGYLRAFIEAGTAVAGSLASALHGDFVSVGIFPNIKPVHRVFDIELVIIHDISAILLPEMHTQEAAVEHSRAHMLDTMTSDLICCVSEATRQDVIRYLNVPPERVFVSHLGCEAAAAEPAIDRPVSDQVPPYVVILGTVEPRKNLRLVADFIRCRPEICQEFAFFFVGRRGWGTQFEEIFGDIMAKRECRDRILFTDYVSEASKRRLLRNARFAIYPSVFEGFGLPVVECMAEGCPVIASHSSSLIELGLDASCYFDPLSLSDFSRVFRVMQSLTDRPDQRRRLSENLRKGSSVFSWQAFADRIIEKIDEVTIPISTRTTAGRSQNGHQLKGFTIL
jgi:glycosyltransferase involved in cell wall biosynthesis